MYLSLCVGDEWHTSHAGSQRPTLVPPIASTAVTWQRIKDLTPGSFPAATIPHPRFLDGTGGGYDARTPPGQDSRAFHRVWDGSYEKGAELTVPDIEHRSQRQVEELPPWMSTCWSAPNREITPAVNAARLQLAQPRSKIGITRSAAQETIAPACLQLENGNCRRMVSGRWEATRQMVDLIGRWWVPWSVGSPA